MERSKRQQRCDEGEKNALTQSRGKGERSIIHECIVCDV